MDTSRVPLVEGLRPDEAQQILDLGQPLRLESGASLFRLGDHADRLFVVMRGRIALSIPMRLRQQEESVLVEERTAGEVVGWSALVPPFRYTLQASAPLETELVAIPRVALLGYLCDESRVSCLLLQNVARLIGQRLQVFQAMWLREMQQVIELQAQPPRRSA